MLHSVGLPEVVSFNDDEPVVCRPQEALDCYLNARMDALMLETGQLGEMPD